MENQDKTYKCGIFHKSLSGWKTLSRNNSQVHEQLRKCAICDKIFTETCLLARHLISHNGESHLSEDRLKCDVCGKIFAKIRLLKLHRQLHEEKPYECRSCSKCFSSSARLERHQTIHEASDLYCKMSKKLSCDMCGTILAHVDDLMTHLHSHLLRGIFQCYICTNVRKFGRKSALNRHLRQHNANRTCKCNRCNKTFLDSWILNDHLYQCSPGKSPHRCEVCLKSFSDKQLLIKHQKKHAWDRVYRCDECKQQFLSRLTLNKHYRSHAPGLSPKPYSCGLCNRQFSFKSSLNRHRHMHEEILHKCAAYGESFKSVSRFGRHLQMHMLPGSLHPSELRGKGNVERCRFLRNKHYGCDVDLLLSVVNYFN